MSSFKNTAVVWPLCAIWLVSCLTRLAQASPPVQVALQASFESAPYLVELVETAAQENSTSYFPLLDRIAEGAFDYAVTEKDLYSRFLQVVREDGHLATPERLSSFQLSLALRSAAPRVEAHFQFYNTSVQHLLMAAQDAVCPIWIHADGKQYCSSTMERAQQDVAGEMDPRELPFDRVLGDITLPPAILYADLASPLFKDYHQTLRELARQGHVSYRVRYRPPLRGSSRPLFVSGYGVELALKRTDYIVIDDRDAEKRDKIAAEQAKSSTGSPPSSGGENDLKDLRPLSSSQVAKLGYSTVRYVMNSTDPMDTLVRVSQDFPSYSSLVVAHNATVPMLREIRANRGQIFPSGLNILWINGVRIDTRSIDPLTLLDHLRRERKLVESFKGLGFSATDAVKLLQDSHIAEVQANDHAQRYNYRDEIEGGKIIIWLNDLEKDSKYKSWPNDLGSLVQRTFPGQLPASSRDLQNIIFPVDLADRQDMDLMVETIELFLKNKVPIRIGLVPTAFAGDGSVGQLKVAHYLKDTFGLASLVHYLSESSSKNKISKPDKACFRAATIDRKVRGTRQRLELDEILASPDYDSLVSRTLKYQERLDIRKDEPVIFANGVPVPRDESWVQRLSMQIGRDLQLVQQMIMEGALKEGTWLPGMFLSQASDRRRSLIIPENPKDVRIVSLADMADSGFEQLLPRLKSVQTDDDIFKSAHMIVLGDFDSNGGLELLSAALEYHQSHPETEILFLHNPEELRPTTIPQTSTSTKLWKTLKANPDTDSVKLMQVINAPADSDEGIAESPQQQHWSGGVGQTAEALGFPRGTAGVVVNGRAIGPLTETAPSTLRAADLDQLVAYEQVQRITPVAKAIQSLGLTFKPADALQFARLTSLVALSAASETASDTMFESGPDVRFDPSSRWSIDHSVISSSNSEDPSINIVAAIDPISETAQKLLPILRVITRLAGTSLKIQLNPRDEVQELPIKRFYRYVLDLEPTFGPDGARKRPEAVFSGMPMDALLTLGMDVPSSWLVAPKESQYDLDNIKLSAVKEDGLGVSAIYELEHILIEGHSRDVTMQAPPRGVQLLLGTESNTDFADTIIMANVGYFQFKAQPGLWKINLKPGRSQRIFNLDSVGGRGYAPQAGDDNNEVALLSFKGVTLFPRLSRKKGHETEDVLESGPKPGSAMDYMSKGLNFAQEVLSHVGLNAGVAGRGRSGERHADINVFSVASGHLYERMLNIMMVSVMRHTKHTVKFWFIEQFLSPSFKSFLPELAREYGFSYEMVTYKWPHWLRSQSEKQREIWGYKILFLDVLFPLSLDKVIFVDADQIVRTDLYELVQLDLEGAPYGFTPMCDSRVEMEGFRFWKQGYWKNFLQGRPYHISALYVVDLNRFRALAAGDRLRGQYQVLSADPGSLSNLDQDLPNHMQHQIPIKSLPSEWLWCETWCSDESLSRARTIDLCNNPLTKEPKLERARRQVPEWTEYDEEIAALARRVARLEQDRREQPDLSEPEKDEL